jgi:Tol biopolymer transport system component
MKQKLFFLIVCLIISVISSGQQKQPDKLLREAIYQEEANGNLEEAIREYQAIVKNFPGEREIAAKALLRIGLCYERLGSQKATEAYKQIIDKYSDQVTLATQAKERLADLQKVEPSGLTMSRLIPSAEYLEAQTLSPDAKKIAAVGWNPDQNILIYDLSTGMVKPITFYNYGRKSYSPYYLVWSHDSKEVAYWVTCSGDTGDEVYPQLRIATLDGESHLLYNSTDKSDLAPCDWLPDKSAVLATVGNDKSIYRLVLISVKNGSLHELTTLHKYEGPGSASVSPDGRFVTFTDATDNGKNDIYILSLNDGTPHILVDHPASDVEPRWSPDCKYIVFRSDRNGSWALWGLAIRDGKADGVPFMILEGMEDQELASWTQKGLCTRTMASASEIYILNINPSTHEIVSAPVSLNTDTPGMSVFPQWSPDGQYLSYTAYFVAEHSQYIMIKPLNGGDTKKYKTPFAAPPVGVTGHWMPDGSGLGVVYWDKDINLYMNKLNPKSGKWDTKKIPAGDFKGGMRQIEWSKDMTTFYYSKMDEAQLNISFISHDLASGKERVLFSYERGDKEDWTWMKLDLSPDGTQLAISYNLKPSVLDIKTGEVHQIEYAGDKTFFAPTFSPDGKYFLVKCSHKNGDDLNELFIMSVKDGSYKSLDISKYLPVNARIMVSDEWSSNGKSIVFDVRTWKSEVNLIQNVIPQK